MHQIVVLGAGMAGMACARALQRLGRRPVLVAPKSTVGNRGETLSFRASPSLETLQWLPLLDAGTAMASAGNYSIWGGAALRRNAGHQGGEAGWHIDRCALEGRMAASLEAEGVDRIAGEVRRLSRSPDAIHIELADGACLASEFVVDCTGRSSVTSGPQALKRLDRLVACYDVIALGEDTDAVAATLVEAVAIGWWYMSLLPGRRVLLGLFTDSDLLPSGLRKDAPKWAEQAARTVAIGARLESLGIDPGASPHRQFAPASTVISSRLVEPRIVRAGDAASALDPLGANGLATALWSGIRAAESIIGLIDRDGTTAQHYEQSCLAGIASHLATQALMYAAERRFSEAQFWQRRSGWGPESFGQRRWNISRPLARVF